MPLSDVWLVVRWWGTLFLVGAAAYPLTKKLFRGWFDEGYFFSKAVGMAVVGWIVYALGTLRVAPFTVTTIVGAMVIVFVASKIFIRTKRSDSAYRIKKAQTILFEELFFFAALLSWSWVKAHEPSIRGLEKFMDFGFMQSILNARYFPPADMWYAGEPVNYYYFGHLVTAVLTKLSGIDLSYTFNLMLATIFALCLTMSFSIGYQLMNTREIRGIWKVGAGMLTAFLVTLAGNLQTLYAFTRGYTGDDVQPFWHLFWPLGEFWAKLPEGLERYWYANATRFIPFSIHEFPSYSFVVSDIHGHVLSIPFVLLAIALLVKIWGDRGKLIFYGFLVGVLLMTNALDGPIYFGLFVILVIIHRKQVAKMIGIVLVSAIFTSLPFLVHFKSFVNGIAVNCPPAFLAHTNIGPLLFEGVEKCQRSPVWMMLILWGFFLYCGFWFVFHKKRRIDPSDEPHERVLKLFFFFSLALIIVPEFLYFKDIYPAHFRSNTMFKLGYQAFILFSIVSGYTIVKVLHETRNKIQKKIFVLFLLPQLFLVSIYPLFSVRSYFNSLRNYEGIYGLNWLHREYPDDYSAILWLKNQAITTEVPVIIEADGDSYTDYARFSAFTGMPTIIGWAVHEWLWRGTYDVVSPRREVVRLIYEAEDDTSTKNLLARFNVRYLVVGTLERQKYPKLVEDKFLRLGELVFEQGETKIYLLTSAPRGGLIQLSLENPL